MNKNISSSIFDLSSYQYQILDLLSACIYLKDTEGVYFACNRYLVELAGLRKKEELIGKTDYDLPWKKKADERKVVDLFVLNYNKPIQIEEKIKDYKGRIKTFLTSKTPLRNERNKAIGIINISLDVTDKKTIEQKLGASKKFVKKTDYSTEKYIIDAADITGDPLHVIVKNSQLLEEQWSVLNDRQRHQFVIVIAQFSRRLAEYALSNL